MLALTSLGPFCFEGKDLYQVFIDNQSVDIDETILVNSIEFKVTSVVEGKGFYGKSEDGSIVEIHL